MQRGADEAGETLSEFIRNAAMDRAEGDNGEEG